MTEKLIQAIRNHEVLYNTQLSQYRDLVARSAAWKKIAQELNLPAEECKENWSKLRNSFTNAIKRRVKCKKKNKELPPWRYEADLTFLKPFLERYEEKADLDHLYVFEENKKKRNSSENSNVSDSDLIEFKTEAVYFDEKSNDDDDLSTAAMQQFATETYETPVARKRKRSNDEINEKILDKLQKISQQTEPTVDDEFDTFAKYIASSLRTLSSENSIKAKLELQTALARIQLLDVQQKTKTAHTRVSQ